MADQKFYDINDLAKVLNKTVASIRAHLYRQQFDAVPPPTRFGRRLAWPVDLVNEWVKQKTLQAHIEREKAIELSSSPRKRGRPTKAESKARRNSYYGS